MSEAMANDRQGHPVVTGPYICTFCEEGFLTQTNLHAHQRSRGHTPVCDRCGVDCLTGYGARKHRIEEHGALVCCGCGELFYDDPAFLAHIRGNHPPFNCHTSQDVQVTRVAIEEHMLASHALRCGGCTEVFYTFNSLVQHGQNARHNTFACRHCRQGFNGLGELEVHLNSPSHIAMLRTHAARQRTGTSSVPVGMYQCSTCIMTFRTKERLREHFMTSSRHHWCRGCNNDLLTAQALLTHDCSNRTPCQCFFCDQRFDHISALAQHVESGKHDFVDRRQITGAVYAMRVVPNITVRSIEAAPPELPRLEKVRLDESAWNGTTFACPVCPETFNKLRKLNAHVNSPVHDDLQFQCPQPTCRKEFVVVSALIQHIESGCCGLANAREIAAQFNNLSRRFSRSLTM